jgi:hypothetical protein
MENLPPKGSVCGGPRREKKRKGKRRERKREREKEELNRNECHSPLRIFLFFSSVKFLPES